jgi:hypothetical protein
MFAAEIGVVFAMASAASRVSFFLANESQKDWMNRRCEGKDVPHDIIT